MNRYEAILHFWFGELKSDQDLPDEKARLWFRKSDETDSTIKQNFEPEIEQAAAGQLAEWKASPRGSLAWMILLDQFTRNVYRGTAKSFAYDPQALELSLQVQEQGDEQKLRPLERVFVYLPMEHSEDLVMQQRAVKAFEQLLEHCPPGLEVAYDSYRDYAVRHLKIIEQFGRFPHRNEILSRQSTTEEIEYLKQPGAGF